MGGGHPLFHACELVYFRLLSPPPPTDTHTRTEMELKRSVRVHSQAERQQRQQGLLGGTGSELGQCLDQFVHHHAQVALQLLPPLLNKLGILQRERERRAEEAKE